MNRGCHPEPAGRRILYFHIKGASPQSWVPVIFQEVVHSIETGEAVCDEQAVAPETEWTITRMPHGRL